jgi:uncharacterized linocin/CFP29 family protein
MTWLDREAASFGQSVWDAIDQVARASAAEVLAGRKAMLVEGPAGVALRAGISDDEVLADGGGDEDDGEAHLHLPRTRTLPLIHRPVKMGVRAVEAFLARNEPLDLEEVAEAARVIARMEDRLLFHGHPAAHVAGLLHLPGAVQLPLGDWSAPGRAADDLLAALAALDGAGRHGPYAAAIAPARYWQLFRPHPGSSLTPHDQLKPAFEGGIVKAPALTDGAVVMMKSASGPKVLVGQDLTAAYDGREGVFHRVSLVESVTLMQGVPGSVAVLSRPH